MIISDIGQIARQQTTSPASRHMSGVARIDYVDDQAERIGWAGTEIARTSERG